MHFPNLSPFLPLTAQQANCFSDVFGKKPFIIPLNVSGNTKNLSWPPVLSLYISFARVCFFLFFSLAQDSQLWMEASLHFKASLTACQLWWHPPGLDSVKPFFLCGIYFSQVFITFLNSPQAIWSDSILSTFPFNFFLTGFFICGISVLWKSRGFMADFLVTLTLFSKINGFLYGHSQGATITNKQNQRSFKVHRN